MCFHFRYLSSNLTWRNGDITQVSLNKRQKVRIAHGPAFVAYGLYYTSIMHTIYLEKSRWCQTPLSQRAVETPGLLTIYLPVVPNLEAAGGGENAMLLVLNLFHFLGELFGYSRMLEKDLTCSSHVHPKLDLNFRETSRST